MKIWLALEQSIYGLHIDKERAVDWSTHTVIKRWQTLFTGTQLTHRFMKGEAMSQAEQDGVKQITDEWCCCLMDISWFMRPVARQANQEEGCTGRFWEGRFKSQALLDEKALMACLAYVDLNPVRATMAETLESSDFTSIKARADKALISETPEQLFEQPALLLPFAGNPRQVMPKGIPFRLTDYLELVWTERILRDDKRGVVAHHLPPILERLQIDPKQWIYMTENFESQFKGLVDSVYELKAACQKLGYQRTPNISAARRVLT